MDTTSPSITRRLCWGVMLLAALAWGGTARAHSPGVSGLGEPEPQSATAEELAGFATLLGQAPRRAVTFAGGLAVAVLDAPGGQQVAAVDLYLKDTRRMPGLLKHGTHISNIHLRGDLIAFQASDAEATYDYLWDSEEPGPPYWKRTPANGGTVTYSPNLEASLVAQFYLRDAQAAVKLARAAALRREGAFVDVVYIDGAVLILAAPSATDNRVWRWLGGEWVAAGAITGVVNHHGVADLNGDGLVEVLAGDSDVERACTSSWSALYTWNAAKSHVTATAIRAQSVSNLSGDCSWQPPACFRKESLTLDRAAQPLLRIAGTQDTTGCPGGGDLPPRRERYERRFAWDTAQGRFAEVQAR